MLLRNAVVTLSEARPDNEGSDVRMKLGTLLFEIKKWKFDEPLHLK